MNDPVLPIPARAESEMHLRGGASNSEPQIGQWLRAGPHAGLGSFAGCDMNPLISSRSVVLDESSRFWLPRWLQQVRPSDLVGMASLFVN